jgi:hypothetical protein
MQEAREMGEHGALLAEEKFSWRRIAAQTEELFAELIEARSACRASEALPRRG